MSEEEKPVAWYYELANYKDAEGRYINWSMHLSFEKPNVATESVRNLMPLYARSPVPPVNIHT